MFKILNQIGTNEIIIPAKCHMYRKVTRFLKFELKNDPNNTEIAIAPVLTPIINKYTSLEGASSIFPNEVVIILNAMIYHTKMFATNEAFAIVFFTFHFIVATLSNVL